MLPSKDANFVGYTFKSSDVFNSMHSTAVGKMQTVTQLLMLLIKVGLEAYLKVNFLDLGELKKKSPPKRRSIVSIFGKCKKEFISWGLVVLSAPLVANIPFPIRETKAPNPVNHLYFIVQM